MKTLRIIVLILYSMLYTIQSYASEEMQAVYDQIKVMRGEIEQLQFEISSLKEQLGKIGSTVEYKFNEIENKAEIKNATETKLANDVQKKLDDEKSDKMNENKDIKVPKNDGNSQNPEYDKAYNMLKEQNIDGAQKAFLKFIENNEGNKLVGNAHYWLGEIAFKNGNYDEAVLYYLKGYQANKIGQKAQDSLYKLAICLAKIGKPEKACSALYKLKKEFPNMSDELKNNVKTQVDKSKCME